jgi:hypothetical protein
MSPLIEEVTVMTLFISCPPVGFGPGALPGRLKDVGRR